jgi:hypothetical protein
MSQEKVVNPLCELLHDNLVIHTKSYYTLQRGKRVFSDSLESMRSRTYFEFEAYLYPPLMLLPLTWQRYGYTREDVNTTYEKIDASYVWAISLLSMCASHEPESAGAGVRSTFQSLFTFLFISRKNVFDVFINAHDTYISQSPQSILCYERSDHKPILPRVVVELPVFEKCRARVPVRAPSFCWVPHYRELVQFKDITMVPVEYDPINQLVYMVRVVRQDVYDQIPVKPKLCIVTMPVLVVVGPDQAPYIMLEEACFFALRHPANRKRAGKGRGMTGAAGKRNNKKKRRLLDEIDDAEDDMAESEIDDPSDDDEDETQ